MSNEHTDDNESTDIDQRTRHALERVLTVTTTDGTPIPDGETPTVVSVHSGNSGKERRVDVREERCTCPDHKHRDSVCYHIRRARYALGVQPVPTETLAACDVHDRFAEHAPGPRVATSDGGIIEAGDDGEIPDDNDGRPDECACPDWNTDGGLPCWPCYRDGFEEPAGADTSDDERDN